MLNKLDAPTIKCLKAFSKKFQAFDVRTKKLGMA